MQTVSNPSLRQMAAASQAPILRIERSYFVSRAGLRKMRKSTELGPTSCHIESSDILNGKVTTMITSNERCEHWRAGLWTGLRYDCPWCEIRDLRNHIFNGVDLIEHLLRDPTDKTKAWAREWCAVEIANSLERRRNGDPPSVQPAEQQPEKQP